MYFITLKRLNQALKSQLLRKHKVIYAQLKDKHLLHLNVNIYNEEVVYKEIDS